MQCQAELHDSL